LTLLYPAFYLLLILPNPLLDFNTPISRMLSDRPGGWVAVETAN